MWPEDAGAQARAKLAEFKSSLAGFHRDNLAMVSGSMRAITRSRDLLHRTRQPSGAPPTGGNGCRDPLIDSEQDASSATADAAVAEIGEVAMDRKIIERDLRRAEKHVREGAAHVRSQQRIVDELAAHGHYARLARGLLQTLESIESSHVDDRARLSDELARADLEDEAKLEGKAELGTRAPAGSKR